MVLTRSAMMPRNNTQPNELEHAFQSLPVHRPISPYLCPNCSVHLP